MDTENHATETWQRLLLYFCLVLVNEAGGGVASATAVLIQSVYRMRETGTPRTKRNISRSDGPTYTAINDTIHNCLGTVLSIRTKTVTKTKGRTTDHCLPGIFPTHT